MDVRKPLTPQEEMLIWDAYKKRLHKNNLAALLREAERECEEIDLALDEIIADETRIDMEYLYAEKLDGYVRVREKYHLNK